MPELVFYLDASAIAKRYWEEAGSDFVDKLYELKIERRSRLYTCMHSIAEVGSAASRQYREGRFTRDDVSSIIKKFMEESKDMLLFLNTDKRLYDHTLIALDKHPLRAGDAMHLAAALDVYSFHGPDTLFVCNDDRLCNAAYTESMEVLRPDNPEAMKHLEALDQASS